MNHHLGGEFQTITAGEYQTIIDTIPMVQQMPLFLRLVAWLLAVGAFTYSTDKPVLAAYTIPQESTTVHPRQFSPIPPVERAAVGEDLRWGLALSGGGIRSAFFSIGALKALYELKLLDSMQVISTVSGGSYAGYWLYSRERHAPGARFGDASFPNAAFQVGVCDVATGGDFFPDIRAVKALLTVRGDLRKSYNRAILRTFGQVHYDSAKLARDIIIESDTLIITDLAKDVRAHRAPYWVINTTVRQPEARNGYASGLFEFTPLLRGNETYGYEPWSGRGINLRQAIAISGAAIAPILEQRVANLRPDGSADGALPDSTTLSDGGHSENLGAIALIRRRVKNIVIVDAEYDEKYEFEAYTHLRTRLSAWGDTIVVQGINDRLNGGPSQLRLDKAIFKGTVSHIAKDGARDTLNIYYVKMALPRTLNSRTAYIRPGAKEHAAMMDSLQNGHRSPVLRGWVCANLHNVPLQLPSLGMYEISLLADLQQDFEKDFPQKETTVQSYNIDRTFALIGLGYFITKDLPTLSTGLH